MSLAHLAHSGFRYVVLALGLAVIAYAVHGIVTRRPFDRTMRRLGELFVASIYLQIFLGVALLFSGRFATGVAGHVLTTAFAAAVAQVVPSVMRRRPPERRTWTPYVVGTLVSLTLLAAGVLVLGRPLLG